MKTTLLFAVICAALMTGCKSPPPPTAPVPQPSDTSQSTEATNTPSFVIHAPDGSAEISIDTSKAPELKDWAEHKLAPVLAKWYPKICALLPSPGFTAPKKWSVTIAPGDGVAATGGTHVTANATWLREQLDKQGVGALLHEEVHVVQQYGGGRRGNAPGSFSYGDITNLTRLVQKLKDRVDPVSAFVASQLAPEENKALAELETPGPKAFSARTNLVGALNRIVRGPNIYNVSLFKDVKLRDTTTSLRDNKPEDGDLARLNRALLEDAYPADLARRGAGRNRGNTGWLTEGIPDYIRWFIYEPKSEGAGVAYFKGRMDSAAKKGNVFDPKYNDSYRVSANFLNFVTETYDHHLITKLNSALRQGQYYDEMWADDTGHTLQELSLEWRADLQKQLDKVKPKSEVNKTKL